MLKPNLARRAQDYIDTLPSKHALQITKKITQLCLLHGGNDVKKVINTSFWRADCGEYRIIYQIVDDMLRIVLVGKRNDGKVYKQLDNLKN